MPRIAMVPICLRTAHGGFMPTRESNVMPLPIPSATYAAIEISVTIQTALASTGAAIDHPRLYLTRDLYRRCSHYQRLKDAKPLLMGATHWSVSSTKHPTLTYN